MFNNTLQCGKHGKEEEKNDDDLFDDNSYDDSEELQVEELLQVVLLQVNLRLLSFVTVTSLVMVVRVFLRQLRTLIQL